MVEQRGLFARLTSFVRWWLLALLVCAAGLVMGWHFLAGQLDEQIRARVERLIAGHYPHLDVRVAAARRLAGKGIELRGLSLRARSGDAQCRECIFIDELFLACQADVTKLLAGTTDVQRLTLRRMRVNAICYREGQWNIAKLLPLPKFGGTVPRILIEDSTVDLKDLSRQPVREMTLREINVQLQADEAHKWRLAGTLRGDHFKHVQVEGLTDATGAAWSAWGTMDGLEMSQHTLNALPRDAAKYLSFLTTLRAQAHFQFRVAHRRGAAEPVDFVLQGHLAEGRLEDPRLPLPLTDLEADVFCDNRQLRVERVTAQSGSTSLELNCRCDNFLTSNPSLDLSACVHALSLDERLYGALPERWQAEWNKFAPRGTVDVRAHVSLTEHRVEPNVDITCRDVSFSYYKFPLRLQQGQGMIHFAADTIRAPEFTAVANGQVVQLAAEFQNPGPQVTGCLTVRSGGPIPLNEEFIAAMHPTGQQILGTLHPSGAITVTQGRIERPQPDGPTQSRWEVELNECALQYERFPYAIGNITGQIVIAGQNWEFRDLRGYHGSNYITCNGDWTAASDGEPGGDLRLHFESSDAPLDESLRAAVGQLNAGAERLWDSLRPRGSVDHVVLTMQHNSRSKQTRLNLRAEKWPPSQNVPGRTISVQPTWLPLQLDNVTGSLTYADGEFQLLGVSGDRNGSRVELAGQGVVTADRRWEITLTKLIADRLDVDRELVDAMPESLRPALRQLKYRGTVSVHGSSWFAGGEIQPLAARWDLLLDLENGALENELRLDHIYGGLRLTGQLGPQGAQSRGELDVDSVITRDIQFTQVRGPFWFDARQLILGSRAMSGRQGEVPRQVTARAMGGELAVDAQVLLDNELHFGADVSLSDGQLSELARAVSPSASQVTGKVYALVHLRGAKAGLHTLQGNGQVRLRDADVYELPVMARLLNVLNLGNPDDTAFTSSDVDFRIEGEQLSLDQIDFNGDLMSLKGNGWMDLNRQINLDFYALVGRDEFQLPLVKALVTEASKRILLIQVVGTVDQPQVIRKPLPNLDETLQRIFPEAAPRTANPRSLWGGSK
jgi:hypothetical protein